MTQATIRRSPWWLRLFAHRPTDPAPGGAAHLYLDLLKKCLTNWIDGHREVAVVPPESLLTAETAAACAARGLRLDGDTYESTMDALVNLYPKLSVGGYVIVDDYGCIPACRQAIHHFRDAHGITDPIVPVDWTGVYWRRSR
jgi:Macrocin-O-methyltransferase (TylF)